jgi:predicted alpha/beta superfamily hydrolase
LRGLNPEVQPGTNEPAEFLAAEEMPPHPRLKLHCGFRSQYLAENRDLIVYLPPGYEEESERGYPVLYMQDGQNLFDGRTSFIPGRTWEMREHADAGIEAGEIEPLVIVGIYNTPDRLAEYTHERDWRMGGGKAAEYGQMLVEELMPWIATRYRVRRDRAATGLAGSSLGGLVALYLGLRCAQHFSKLAVFSPSVWWNNKSILGYLNERAPDLWERPRLWLDVGDREGRRTLSDAAMLNRRLKANGWREGETLHFERVEGGTHDEASWARRVRPALKFLFPAR